ncbi:SRPBCC family protein [Streptomyces sp. SL13]|uniref:SRPBCC family protein n=1 Tax=Streptantibioticus silvisoli TaxID=2705255 RepID=A0AA90KFG8_9ACTN|nr:SRPBCC family protein [Streptantibioticus silvisoli]MDI5969255.1 SRPBCC family protein [Streptantibioticus silvisoli]
MALIAITRRCELPAEEAWRRLTRWEGHAAHVPLTRIVVETPPPNGPGTRFTARTGVGAAGFDDPMEVVRWQPPQPGAAGHCRLEKRGRVVTGWAQIEVAPDGTGCVVRWREDIRVLRLPAVFDGLTAAGGRLMFGRAVDGLLAGS